MLRSLCKSALFCPGPASAESVPPAVLRILTLTTGAFGSHVLAAACRLLARMLMACWACCNSFSIELLVEAPDSRELLLAGAQDAASDMLSLQLVCQLQDRRIALLNGSSATRKDIISACALSAHLLSDPHRPEKLSKGCVSWTSTVAGLAG